MLVTLFMLTITRVISRIRQRYVNVRHYTGIEGRTSLMAVFGLDLERKDKWSTSFCVHRRGTGLNVSVASNITPRPFWVIPSPKQTGNLRQVAFCRKSKCGSKRLISPVGTYTPRPKIKGATTFLPLTFSYSDRLSKLSHRKN